MGNVTANVGKFMHIVCSDFRLFVEYSEIDNNVLNFAENVILFQ